MAATEEIVFFDLETTIPFRVGQKHELLEFAAVIVSKNGLAPLRSYSTLIRPKSISSITRQSVDCNGITIDGVANAPEFELVADKIFEMLHGRIWAGHNIIGFDMVRIKEYFLEYGRTAPEPIGVIDTLVLLRKTFGQRAGNLKRTRSFHLVKSSSKLRPTDIVLILSISSEIMILGPTEGALMDMHKEMARLAEFCGLGEQKHRSLADVELNIEVLKSIATTLFLEFNFPDIFPLMQSNSTPNTRTSTRGNGNQTEEDTSMETLPYTEPCGSSNFSINKCTLAEKLPKERVKTAIFRTEEVATVEVKSGHRKSLTLTSPPVQFPAMNPSYSSLGKGRKTPSISEGISENRANSEALVTDIFDISVLSTSLESIATEMEANESNECNTELKKGDEGDEIRTESYPDSPEASDYYNAESSFTESPENLQKISETEDYHQFLEASWVKTEILEARRSLSFGSSFSVVYHENYPLQLRECNARVRFTISKAYAYDNRGKPKFSILIEPSRTACEVIRKCEEVIKNDSGFSSRNLQWRPALIMEGFVHGVRLSIQTKGIGREATYVTEFYKETSSGLEKLDLGCVDMEAMRNLIPRGCHVDVGFLIDSYAFDGFSGLRLVAKWFTLR